MNLIYVCSPLRGNIEANIKKADEYCWKIAMDGHIPIAPHAVFTRFLDDLKQEERQLGIDMGLELLKRCDELMVCGKLISEGMKREINMARNLGIPVTAFDEQSMTAYEEYIQETQKMQGMRL